MTTPETIDRTDERFIIDYGDAERSPARMVAIDALTEHLSKDIEYSTYGYGNELPTVYRYVPGVPALLESLTGVGAGSRRRPRLARRLRLRRPSSPSATER